MTRPAPGSPPADRLFPNMGTPDVCRSFRRPPAVYPRDGVDNFTDHCCSCPRVRRRSLLSGDDPHTRSLRRRRDVAADRDPQPPGPDGAREIDIDVDLSKRITPDVGITLSDSWQHLQPKGMPVVTGLGAFSAELDYQFLLNAPHQAIGLVGVSSTFAHTGRVQALGAPDFTTVSPVIDFGKAWETCRNRCPGCGHSRLPAL